MAEGWLTAEHDPPTPRKGSGPFATRLCSQRAGARAQHSQCLFGLMAVRVKAVGWELLDVRFAEASGLGIP